MNEIRTASKKKENPKTLRQKQTENFFFGSLAKTNSSSFYRPPRGKLNLCSYATLPMLVPSFCAVLRVSVHYSRGPDKTECKRRRKNEKVEKKRQKVSIVIIGIFFVFFV
jgi:hypothetical protein